MTADSGYLTLRKEIRIMPHFYKPANLTETCELLSRYREKATVLAGGTDVMVSVNRGKLCLDTVIAIGDMGLNHIRTEHGHLIIGATATHSEICNSPVVLENAPLLAEACGQIGSRAIRNMGTIGGNLVNASREADGLVALTALEAQVRLVSSAGERTVPAEAFVTGHRETIRTPEEVLQEVIIPLEDHETRWGWHKLGQRKAYVCSIVSVAIVLQMHEAVCKKARIALGSVGPKPFLSRGGMQILEGRPLNAPIIEEAARIAADETSPTDDHRATAWYRKRVSKVMIRRVLEKISGQEGGGDADS